MWLKICFIGLGAVLFLISAVFFAIGAVFTRFPGKTDRAPGRLVKYKYKKDVPVYEKKYRGAPGRRAGTIHHLTMARYVYTVNGRVYRAKCSFMFRPKHVPDNPWIVYLKRFPRISYVKTDDGLGANAFLAKGLLFALLGLLLILSPLGRHWK